RKGDVGKHLVITSPWEDNSSYVSVFVALASEGTEFIKAARGTIRFIVISSGRLILGLIQRKHVKRKMSLLTLLATSFKTHKLVLPARSPFFKSKFFNELEPNSIYETLIAKLLAAADKYYLNRLRLLCESHICKGVSVNYRTKERLPKIYCREPSRLYKNWADSKKKRYGSKESIRLSACGLNYQTAVAVGIPAAGMLDNEPPRASGPQYAFSQVLGTGYVEYVS
ncbi:LOW QUALITY PROTEIN: hypothetical protein HID58_038804, partial [Brassica napus]